MKRGNSKIKEKWHDGIAGLIIFTTTDEKQKIETCCVYCQTIRYRRRKHRERLEVRKEAEVVLSSNSEKVISDLKRENQLFSNEIWESV